MNKYLVELTLTNNKVITDEFESDEDLQEINKQFGNMMAGASFYTKNVSDGTTISIFMSHIIMFNIRKL